MRFRAVSIYVETEDGLIARYRTEFGPGLVVVSGPNSVGKSLLFQSLIYGLGLDGMYGSSHDHGLLTRAMTEEIRLGGEEHRVRRSSVAVEVESGEGQVLTAQRDVAGGSNDRLVATWTEAAITAEASDDARRDYFVRRGGAAVDDAGFHKLLADFLGWELPIVPAFNNKEVPLYLEILFPFLAIEQKTGWSGILPRIPTYLQVRDPLQRGVEFFLGLELVQRARDLQRLIDREADLRRQYEVVVSGLYSSATLRSARLIGVGDWGHFRHSVRPGAGSVEIQLGAEILEGSSWETIEIVAARPLSEIEMTAPGSAPERPNEEELNARLAAATERMRELSGQLSEVEETLDLIHTQLGSLRTRLAAVDEEKRRYEQLSVLVGLGSPVAVATFAHHECPTCQQSLDGLEHQPDLAALDYEKSLALLTEQARTLKALQEDAERAANDQVLVRTSFEREAGDLRREMKAIRADLVTPDVIPSVADLQRRLQEESRRADLQNLQIKLLQDAERLTEIARDLRSVLAARAGLGSTDLTAEEQGRLDRWTEAFRQLLRAVNVTSFPIAEVVLPVSGKPGVDGYDDVRFQASASDVIRLRWSYALSLMSVSQAVGGPHPGLLMMDEPRQQEVESFREFLALAARHEGQIILMTSEPVNVIEDAVGSADVQIIRLDGLLLQVSQS
jgi:hypothetical protein